jgi:hypothetical protein
MNGRSGRSNSHGGRGRGDRIGRGSGRGQSYTGASKASKSGLCKTLDDNVFDYGHKEAVDQMRTSWEKLVQYVGATYGQDISNELHNKTTAILAEPVHTTAALTRHAAREQMIHTGQANLQPAGSGYSRGRPGCDRETRDPQQCHSRSRCRTEPGDPHRICLIRNSLAEILDLPTFGWDVPIVKIL